MGSSDTIRRAFNNFNPGRSGFLLDLGPIGSFWNDPSGRWPHVAGHIGQESVRTFVGFDAPSCLQALGAAQSSLLEGFMELATDPSGRLGILRSRVQRKASALEGIHPTLQRKSRYVKPRQRTHGEYTEQVVRQHAACHGAAANECARVLPTLKELHALMEHVASAGMRELTHARDQAKHRHDVRTQLVADCQARLEALEAELHRNAKPSAPPSPSLLMAPVAKAGGFVARPGGRPTAGGGERKLARTGEYKMGSDLNDRGPDAALVARIRQTRTELQSLKNEAKPTLKELEEREADLTRFEAGLRA